MINCDYILERDMGKNEKRMFKPGIIPKELPNIVCIEGPNSSGKSTLLNILALSMYGSKSRKLNPALEKKIKSLLNSEYQNLSFDVEIENKDRNLKIVSKKEINCQEINIYESKDGEKLKPLSPEIFGDRYNLIYDIPSNPTERLKEFIVEIREEQQRYGNKVSNLSEKIRKISTEIFEIRNLNRLENLKDQLKKMQEDKGNLEEKRDNLKLILDDLELYSCYEYYTKYSNSCRRTVNIIQELEKEAKNEVKVGSKSTSEYHDLKYNIEREIKKIEEEFQKVTPLLINLLSKAQQSHLNIWNRIQEKLYNTVNDLEFSRDLDVEITHFNNELTKIQLREVNNPSLSEAKVVSELVEFLKRYEDSNLTLPGVDITLRDFIRALEKKNVQNQKIVEHYENVLTAQKILEKIKKMKDGVEINLPKLKRLAERKSDDSKVTSRVSELKKQITKYRKDHDEDHKKYEFYYGQCINKKINIKEMSNEEIEKKIRELEGKECLLAYIKHDETKLQSEISTLKSELKDIYEEINNKKAYIKDHEALIKEIEGKEPHKYEKYYGELQELQKKTIHIREKFCNEYDEVLKALNSEKVRKDTVDEKYIIQISKYLAKRIGTFRHIDREYKAQVVDLISRQIITEEGLIVRFDDMGTGQSQSAYLTGLLNTKDDKRKIIALFDEVAMMDSTSLKPIYDRFRELYEADRLLVGIVVQKADSLKISEI